MVISQNYNGNEMKVAMDMDFKMDYLVKSAIKNEYVLEVKYSELGMKMEMPQAELDYGSGKEINDTVNNLMSIMFDNMVGKSFEMVLDNKGRVKSISGFDKIIAHLFDNLPNVEEAQKDQLLKQMDKAFGEDSFKQSMEAATAIFPENPVKVGDTWEIESNLKSTIDFNIKNVYTLEKVTDEVYVIKAKGRIATPAESDFTEANGVLMKQELTGTSESELNITKSTGWIKESIVKQNISGKTFMKQVADGEIMEMPMTLVSNTTVTNQ